MRNGSSESLNGRRAAPPEDDPARTAVTISNIRNRLRRLLGHAGDVDPIPCVMRA
jgi:hypothetical protein